MTPSSQMNEGFRAFFENALASLRLRPDMHHSPKWEESALCTSLRIWETVLTENVFANKWEECWQKYKKKANPTHPAWWLSDTPLLRKVLSKAAEKPPGVAARSVLRVRKGMKKVFDQVVKEVGGGIQSESVWSRGAILIGTLIERQLAPDPQMDDSEALEANLLALIQWLEWFLSRGKTRQATISIWRTEIRKTRKFGPPSTKTFSTASSLEERLSLEKSVSPQDVHRAFGQLAFWMDKLISELGDYLEFKRKPKKLVHVR